MNVNSLLIRAINHHRQTHHKDPAALWVTPAVFQELLSHPIEPSVSDPSCSSYRYRNIPIHLIPYSTPDWPKSIITFNFE